MIEFSIAGIAFVGTLVSILAGWWAAKEPWDGRKAGGSILAGLVYAVAAGGTASQLQQVLTPFVILTTFLSAVGINFYGKTIWSNTLGK